MKVSRIAPWVLLLIAGTGWWYLGSRRSEAQAGEIARLQASILQSQERTSGLLKGHDSLARELAEAAKPITAPAPSVQRPPATPEPPRPAGRQALIVALDGAVAPSFIQAFALSDTEAAAIRQGVAEARLQLTQLAVEHASFVLGSRASPRDAVISIEPFGEAGAKVRANLLRQFEEALGPDRFAVFLGHYSGAPLAADLGNFGAGRRTITISRFPNNYTVSDAAAVVPGTRSGGGAGRFSPRTLAELKDRSFPELFAKFAAELAAMPLYSQP